MFLRGLSSTLGTGYLECSSILELLPCFQFHFGTLAALSRVRTIVQSGIQIPTINQASGGSKNVCCSDLAGLRSSFGGGIMPIKWNSRSTNNGT